MKKYLSEGKKEVVEAIRESKPRGGRVRIVTDEMIEAMLTAIASGLTPQEASMALGVTKDWISRQSVKNPDFEIEINKAMQSYKLYHLGNIARHAKKSWQASAWLLERSFPERFNSRIAQDIASRAQTKEAPKWFGVKIEDIEVVEEIKEYEHKGDTETDGRVIEEKAKKDETT